jgi:hypothetical protein
VHATGRTGMTQVIGAFCDYANVPKNIKRFIKYDINCLWAYLQRKVFWNEIIFVAESSCSVTLFTVRVFDLAECVIN